MRVFLSFIITIFTFISLPVFADDLIISEVKTSFIGNVIDPTMLESESGALLEPFSSENQMPVSDISPITQVEQAQAAVTKPQTRVDTVSVSGVHSYNGKLVKTAKKSGDTLHKYSVLLPDGDKLTLETQRNYDEFAGKNISITIEGTKKNFKVVSLEGPGLIKSGPGFLIILAGMIAILGGVIRRKLVNY